MTRGNEKVMHYKMYKAKKQWLFAGMGVVMMSGALLMGGSTTARADTAGAATTTTAQSASTASTATGETTQPAELTAYQDYKDGGYKDAQNQLDQTKTQVDTDTTDYNAQKSDYDSKLNQYQTTVDDKAPGYQTTDQTTKDSMDTEYNGVKTDYDQLKQQQGNIAQTVTAANAQAKAAQDKLDALYNALPDSIKNAGKEIAEYNKTTKDTADKLVADSTANAYQTALKSQTGNLNAVLKDVDGFTTNATAAHILVPANDNADGSVTATLLGKTYTDANGDGQITYEDDVLPSVTADLKSDLAQLTNDPTSQTPLKGSYADIATLFNYMKQIADTAFPYQTADGTEGRITSGQATDASYDLMDNGTGLASGFGSTYATELLNSIEATKQQIQTAMEQNYTKTGNTFDEAGFTKSFDENLKAEALKIYDDQTNQIISIADNVLKAFQAADASGNVLWATSPSAGVKTNTLTATLTNAIATAKQQIADGKTALTNMAPADNFLTVAYSTGDPASGFTQTINSIWGSLYNTLDRFGMSMSPLLRYDAVGADTNATHDAAGNVIYSPDFIAANQPIYTAASTLAGAITTLMQQSSVISDNYEDVLNDLLTANGFYDLPKPEMTYLQTPTLADPTAPQQVNLVLGNMSVHLIYVDDGTPGNDGIVTVKMQALTGHNGDTASWHAVVPAGYQLAKDQAGSGEVTIGTGTDATVVVHLVKQATNPGGGDTGGTPTTPDTGGSTDTPEGGSTAETPSGDTTTQPTEDNTTSTDAGGATATDDNDSQSTGVTSDGNDAQSGRAVGTASEVTTQSGEPATTENTSAVAAQAQLPQTNETNESAVASLGLLSMSMLLGALGLKKRKHN